MNNPILYSFRRWPYAIRARLALTYVDLDIEIREISLKRRPESLYSISSKGTVPVLQTNNKVIDESIEIMKWAFSEGNKKFLDANYKDEFYFDEQNDHKSNSYSLLNASLVYSKDNFSLSLWGKNLSDEKYAIRGYSFVLLPSTTTGYTDTKSDYRSYGAKKSLGITFKYSFWW